MSLEDNRTQIDSIDDQILSLFMQRMDISAKIASDKAKSDSPVADKVREREILERIRSMAGDRERFANALYGTIFAVSKAYQNEILDRPSDVATLITKALENRPEVFPQTGIVACQGVEGSYSQMAADRMFSRGKLMYFKSFEAVFDAVDSGLCAFGILPVENSSNGSVRAVYELMREKRAYIVRSKRLFVHHELLAKPGVSLADIKEVVSHEQALGQCSSFISTLGSDVEISHCANTAEAVRDIANGKRSDVAAIASPYCGELYGLVPVASNIQNSENNYTRFICIAKEPMIYPGANRISLILTLKHQPGSLYEVLGKFAALGINLLKLESLPMIGRDFDFMFFFDIEASVQDEGVVNMLSELERSADSLVFLGSYSEV